MDLSFKMVQGKTNLYSITGWDEGSKRIQVFVYAFLNLETRIAYETMFTHIFKVMSQVARQPIRFPHIHSGNDGWRIITVDMCKKQAPGKHSFFI